MVGKVQDDILHLDDSTTKLKPDEDVIEYGDTSPPKKKKNKLTSGLLSKSKTKETVQEKNVSFIGDENDGVLNLNLKN